MDGKILMYNPVTNAIIRTTKEFRFKWIKLGFIDLSNSNIQCCMAS